MNKPFQFGIMVDVVPFEKISKSWDYFEVPACIHCDPLFSNDEWQQVKALYKADGRPSPVSGFMFGPGKTGSGCCGPYYDRDLLLFALERQFPRMAELGIKYAGCYGGHFYLPDGFDRNKAMDQAISTTNILADMAEKYGMEIALEPMARPDTLFPTYLEGIAFAKRTGRKNVKVMADLNYFVAIDQKLEDILKEPEYCMDVHIAGRAAGGVQPNIGGPEWEKILVHLFEVLKEAGYDKGVTAACPWRATNGATEIDYQYETDTALAYLHGLRDKVYH